MDQKMPSFPEAIEEYRKQLKSGYIQVAYRGLLEYMQGLRTYLQARYPHNFVSGSIYPGYIDMTYFSFIPQLFKEQNLKIAIVFLHTDFRFEAWLAGINKVVQARYWNIFKEHSWNPDRLVAPGKGVDSILEHILVENPDFRDLSALTRQIEAETLKFCADLEHFFAIHKLE